ncbi:Hypothetical predicted protein [Mytilus galloprovincialis]|uniref:Uncharacterized protein n=1 Tax=Mytilus galloprovincialis TaxID=29158 RepID=A0A8B6CP13_MYTGA|nr:Hypothetical predicted protein [Mytilus galloprovincialis]
MINVSYTQGAYIVEVPGGPTFLLLPESSDDTFDPTGIMMLVTAMALLAAVRGTTTTTLLTTASKTASKTSTVTTTTTTMTSTSTPSTNGVTTQQPTTLEPPVPN